MQARRCIVEGCAQHPPLTARLAQRASMHRVQCRAGAQVACKTRQHTSTRSPPSPSVNPKIGPYSVSAYGMARDDVVLFACALVALGGWLLGPAVTRMVHQPTKTLTATSMVQQLFRSPGTDSPHATC